MTPPSSMTANISYASDLLDFIRFEVMGDGDDLDETTPLLEYGILDSITMVSVLAFIRSRFGVEVRGEEITVSNFENVGTLARMVATLMATKTSVAATPSTSAVL